jgi:hypothetical protein
MSRLTQNFADFDNGIQSILDNAMGNGRIDLMTQLPSFDIPAYNRLGVDNKMFHREATMGQLAESPLSKVFFSEANVNALQEGIRYRVYVETGGKFTIGRQSDQELRIIMRSIYYQYGRNDGSDCVAQTRELNAKVLDWTVPEVLSNLMQYQVYKKDASTLPMPLEHSQMMSTKGTKVLEQTSFI